MEKSSKNIDMITRNIVRSGGLHQPSANFMENVMGAISKEESRRVSYTPLIPKRVWIILCVGIVALFTYLIFIADADYVLWGNLMLFERISTIDLSLPELNLSKEMIYGIGFLGLFLLQIPFLKRQLDRVEH